MTSTQMEVLRLDDAPAARALRQNIAFLGLFLEPCSPSGVAAPVGMAANLAHHHARKLADLGLLIEVKREGGKVFYQLAAREFRVPSELLPPQDAEGNGTADLRELSEGFLQAYERSWARMRHGEEDVHGFGTREHPVLLPAAPDVPNPEAHPTHLDALTLRLSPERYRQLARALSALLDEAYAEGHSTSGPHCTLAVLGFQASETPGGDHLARCTNSFLGSFLGAK